MSKKKNNNLSELLDELKSIQLKVEDEATPIDQIPDLIKRATEIKNECEAALTKLEDLIQSEIEK
ncbi:MAG: exodeoxyribonuclease VII small subunit [Saprospiraceae bacterium]|nr:exodeoxyribonuclease VII small subunit [Saprospiraceae bacterium]